MRACVFVCARVCAYTLVPFLWVCAYQHWLLVALDPARMFCTYAYIMYIYKQARTHVMHLYIHCVYRCDLYTQTCTHARYTCKHTNKHTHIHAHTCTRNHSHTNTRTSFAYMNWVYLRRYVWTDTHAPLTNLAKHKTNRRLRKWQHTEQNRKQFAHMHTSRAWWSWRLCANISLKASRTLLGVNYIKVYIYHPPFYTHMYKTHKHERERARARTLVCIPTYIHTYIGLCWALPYP
jgi:hypothetical protein